jgi:hypothetical protein
MPGKTIITPKMVLFVSLSVLDLLLTWGLLNLGEGQVYESNPIANWWLSRWGWLGLTAFKAVAVLTVGMLAGVISWYRPRLAEFVLSFGCFASVLVVTYSGGVLVGMMSLTPDRLGTGSVRLVEESNRQLDRELASGWDFKMLRQRVSDDLLHERCTLPEAVRILSEAERFQFPRWVQTLRRKYPGLSDEECIAANLLEYTMASVKHRDSAATISRRLETAYGATYQTPVAWTSFRHWVRDDAE